MSRLTPTLHSLIRIASLLIILHLWLAKGYAQSEITVHVTDARTEGRYLERANGSIRVVKALVDLADQYLECNGEGPKKILPGERFKGPASCVPGPIIIAPRYSFDLILSKNDSLLVFTNKQNFKRNDTIFLRDSGFIRLPVALRATLGKDGKAILKENL